MSSFNINGPSQMPQITEAQNMMNNGGGGNTGYLDSGRKKKKKKEEEIDPAILKEEGEDKFERSEIEYEDDDDYYGRNTPAKEEKQDAYSSEEKKSEILNTDNIKNKFLGLIGSIEKIIKPEDKTEGLMPSVDGDFLTLSKNEMKDTFNI